LHHSPLFERPEAWLSFGCFLVVIFAQQFHRRLQPESGNLL